MLRCDIAESEDTIHLVKKIEYSINPTQINEIFVFQDGVVVFWNIDHAQVGFLQHFTVILALTYSSYYKLIGIYTSFHLAI